jgi:hypothetical protein
MEFIGTDESVHFQNGGFAEFFRCLFARISHKAP